MEQLSYIDEHSIRIDAPRARVWTVLQDYADRWLRRNERSALTLLLGARPRAGFARAASEPERYVSFTGRHRFSRYELGFELADAPGEATQLRAQTYAEFPGVHGRLYRALVIGTGGHKLATNHLLRDVRRRCDARPTAAAG